MTFATRRSRSAPARVAPKPRTGRRCSCACTRDGPSVAGYAVEILDMSEGEEAGIKGRGPRDSTGQLRFGFLTPGDGRASTR
jgi:hypothetical protein